MPRRRIFRVGLAFLSVNAWPRLQVFGGHGHRIADLLTVNHLLARPFEVTKGIDGKHGFGGNVQGGRVIHVRHPGSERAQPGQADAGRDSALTQSDSAGGAAYRFAARFERQRGQRLRHAAL